MGQVAEREYKQWQGSGRLIPAYIHGSFATHDKRNLSIKDSDKQQTPKAISLNKAKYIPHVKTEFLTAQSQ